MKKTKRWIVAAVVVVGLTATGWVIAQEAPARSPVEAPPGEYGRRGFDLTDEQLDRMDELQIAGLKKTMPLETDLRIKQMELEALWRADEINPKAIIGKVKEVHSTRQKVAVARAENRIAVYQILTPEQRERAKQFRGLRGMRGRGRGMRGAGRGMRGSRGPGMMRGQGRRHRGMSGPGSWQMAPPGPEWMPEE